MSSAYRKQGIIIACSLLLMALIAGYSYGYVYNRFINETNEPFISTTNNKSGILYISGIIGWIIIFGLDLLVSRALCKYYNRVNKSLSILNTSLRIAYSIILAIAIFSLTQGTHVFYDSSSTSEKIQTIQAAFQSFENIWSFGLILFGFHLLAWGILSLKVVFIPNIFGVLLLSGGLSYIFIHTAKTFSFFTPDLIISFEQILVFPMTVAEIGFAIWILVKKE